MSRIGVVTVMLLGGLAPGAARGQGVTLGGTLGGNFAKAAVNDDSPLFPLPALRDNIPRSMQPEPEHFLP